VKRRLIVIGLLSVLLLCAIVFSLNVGDSPASLAQLPKFWNEIVSGGKVSPDARVSGTEKPSPSEKQSPERKLSPGATILWRLRLPRILLACLTGAALAVAGAGYQGLFRNPLADPFVIGSSSGAAVGVALVVVFDVQSTFLGYSALPLAAFAGALLAVLCVFLIAGRNRETPMVSLLLAGVALSTFLSACVSLLMLIGSERLVVIFGWLMGSLNGQGWTKLGMVAPLILAGLVVMMTLSRSLDALSFGEETAFALGLGRKRFLALLLSAASLLTAAAVAAAGVIGFVGLICPHIARRLVGARHAVMIPVSGLLGALLLLLADDLARTVIPPSELPVGILTAMLGGPFFLFLLKTQGARR